MNVKDNRSFWVYLLLSIVTCGLYSIYFWYVYVEDLNTIFYGDGEDSPNYIIVLLLSWVTCGIYGVYWRYKQANRMYRESYDRYGVMIEENGSAILLWTLLGYLTGGIGQLVADYFMIQNLNKTALVYNSRAYSAGEAFFMATSMVKGNPMKLMLQFAFPLLIGNLLQQTYNIIDAAIVGQALGPEALASVGASSSVQFLVLGFCMGSCTGFSVPVAKYFGAGKLDKMRDYIFNGAALAVLIAAILTTLCSLLCAPILHLLSVPSDIFADAYAYQLVIFLGIPFSILYNYLSSILRAVGDSRTPFLFLAFSAILNIFLDLFCIIILHLGCAGAAIATISAQAISGLLCLFFISRKVKLLLPTKENRTLRKDAAQELLAMGIPTGLQFSITAIGSMVMQSANNGLGSVYVSAFTAAMKIKQFMMCPFDAISTAASVFCSQNLGAGQAKRIHQGLRKGVLVGVGYGAFAGVIMILFGLPLTKLFIVSSAFEAINASAKYLRCLGFFYWMLGILNVCRMVTQGLGYSGRAVFSGVMEMLARTIVCLGFVGAFGFTAICFADQAAWLAACCYIAPTCLYCVKKSTKMIADRGAK